jgi:hypothetical protein
LWWRNSANPAKRKSKKDLFPGAFLLMLDGMAKQVLGRNLGALLDGGARKSGDPFAPVQEPVGSGVRSLMRGQPTSPAEPLAPATSKKSIVPGWYLFCADLLLAALALVVVCKSPHPLTWQREVFCAVALVLGACLALGAVCNAEGQRLNAE